MIHNYKPITPSVVEKLIQGEEQYKLLDIQAGILNTEWLENNFPIASWGRINWNQVPNSFCEIWDTNSDLSLKFNNLLLKKNLKGSVVVSWGNAIKLPIEIDVNTVLKYAISFFEEDFDIWLCSETNGWCIEIYHEGEICFGYTSDLAG
jgi:hypothetical protein